MTNHKETIKGLRKELLELSDSLGISEETLWNLTEDDASDSIDGITDFIFTHDDIVINQIISLHLFNYIQTIKALSE